MKKKLILLTGILSLVLVCSKSTPAFPWSGTTFADARVAAGSRLIQLEFFTDT